MVVIFTSDAAIVRTQLKMVCGWIKGVVLCDAIDRTSEGEQGYKRIYEFTIRVKQQK